MTAERPTKARLQELEGLLAREKDAHERTILKLAGAEDDRDAWKAAHLDDPEADALAGCVRALEEMLNIGAQRSRDQSSYGLTFGSAREMMTVGTADSPVGRILLHLAGRYEVPINAVESEPIPVDPNVCRGCGRP